jgi:hypothetical protein
MHPVRPRRLRTILPALLLLTVALSACGDDEETTDAPVPAPEASVFPPVESKSLDQLAREHEATNELVVSPGGLTFSTGRNRFGFAVFEVDRTQVNDADVAIYAEPVGGGPATGPHPARIESLETEPAFVARNTAADPDAAKAVYVSDLAFDRPGEWRLIALVRDGDRLLAARMPSLVVKSEDRIPDVGEKAPRVSTPTAEEVGGDLEKIDTRIPPSTMHSDDLADVLGKEPVVLLFATPALCQSRVCGPVVDVAEQVKRDRADDAAFIHMEIYNENLANRGLRPQVRAYKLQTEPWLFVIDCEGNVATRIEGAFGAAELEDAIDRVAGTC